MIAALAIGWLLNIMFSLWYTTGQNRSSVGLPLAFVLSTTFLYIGFIAYLNPNYTHLRNDGSLYLAGYDFDYDTVYMGTLASLVGVTSFNLGVHFSRLWAKEPARALPSGTFTFDASYSSKLIGGLALFGLASFALARVSLPIPMIDAILQVGRNSALVVVCLGLAILLLTGSRTSYRWWVVAGMAIPATYMVVFGFASYGFITLCSFVAFYLAVMRRTRRKLWKNFAIGMVGTYGLLSAFIVWMNFRATLRTMIADGSSLTVRVEAIWEAALSIRFLNWFDFQSLDLLTLRLNQYIFVGKAIELHTLDPTLRLGGETIWPSVLAWVPRFLWPGKPEMNSNEFMRTHTGIGFGDSASFGNGPIMEYYVNFGWAGIVIGMLFLGFLLGRIDRRAVMHLRSGRLLDFAKWFAVGLAFIAPLTSLFFMINTAVATYVIFSVFQYLLGPARVRVRRQKTPRTSSNRLQLEHKPVTGLRI